MSDHDARRLYRLYWINRSDHIDAMAKPIEAACDAEAMRQAEILARGDRVELWHEARLVVHLDPVRPLGLVH